ncbi:unnamed protein product [Closterium sp. Yama58-4]|nr:unnamed protein product [Closterium sp. Yama58-4]
MTTLHPSRGASHRAGDASQICRRFSAAGGAATTASKGGKGELLALSLLFSGGACGNNGSGNGSSRVSDSREWELKGSNAGRWSHIHAEVAEGSSRGLRRTKEVKAPEAFTCRRTLEEAATVGEERRREKELFLVILCAGGSGSIGRRRNDNGRELSSSSFSVQELAATTAARERQRERGSNNGSEEPDRTPAHGSTATHGRMATNGGRAATYGDAA